MIALLNLFNQIVSIIYKLCETIIRSLSKKLAKLC